MYIKCNNIYFPNQIKKSGYLEVVDTKLGEVLEHIPETEEFIDYSNYQIIPGFIDQHIHGWGTGSFGNDKSVHSINEMKKNLPYEGVTSFLATSGAEPIDEIIEGVGDAGREDHISGRRRAKEPGQLLPGLQHHALHFVGSLVVAPVDVESAPDEEAAYCLRHSRRFRPGRTSVVKVNLILHNTPPLKQGLPAGRSLRLPCAPGLPGSPGPAPGYKSPCPHGSACPR